MLFWHHGTKENNWRDSGWVLNGQFYPVQYTDDPNGPDKVIGLELLKKDMDANPHEYQSLLKHSSQTESSLSH